jgi:geranylgeranyl diphosphate synthase type II
VQAKFGERLAVLAGDALIVLAFDVLAAGADDAVAVRRLPALLRALALRTGAPAGIVAGQAWECEDWVALPDYQRAKTGSLFAAATEMGALAAGGDPARWRAFGEHLGEAYLVAVDIRDVAADAQWLGKPVGRDHKLGRPNAVAELGMSAALEHFDLLVQRSAESVPAGPGAGGLRRLLHAEAERLLPPALVGRCRAAEGLRNAA